MRELAVWILNLPDGKAVFQRRAKDAVHSPGLLGFFGGHLDVGEAQEDAAIRELGEETSLDVDSLTKHYLGEVAIESAEDPRLFYVWEATVPDASFEVYEGDGAEVLSVDEALQRTDIVHSTKQILMNFRKG